MQQLPQVVQVLHGQRPVEALVVVEQRDLLGCGLRAEDPARGTPGSACSRPNTTTVTMRMTTSAWAIRRVRYRRVSMPQLVHFHWAGWKLASGSCEKPPRPFLTTEIW